MKELKPYFAECIGTFFLVLCGAGSIVLNDHVDGLLTNMGIALAFGLVVMLMIFWFGKTSGAHINPAVTLGFWIAGKFSGKYVLPYIVAQLIGAALASAILWGLSPEHPTLGATVPHLSIFTTFGLEVLITYILMAVIIFIVTSGDRSIYVVGAVIGATVWLAALLVGPLTGASMNPARSFGPALFAGSWDQFWIYILAPTIGAALAIVTCRAAKGSECCPYPNTRCEP